MNREGAAPADVPVGFPAGVEQASCRRASPARWIVAERVVRHAGWFAIFLFLAPILGPHDYGLFVVALAGVSIIETLLSEIPANAILGLQVVEEAHLSAAFLATSGVGAAMSLLLYFVAGEFSAMADDPRLADVYQSLALLPVLSALMAVPLAVVQREERAAVRFFTTLAGVAAGGGAGIGLAIVGGGAWSLVAQIVTQRFVEIAALWIGAGRMIGLGWSRRHLAELVRGLSGLAVAPALSSIGRQLPRFLIGTVLGPTAAGLYLVASAIADAFGDVFSGPGALAARAAALVGRAPADPTGSVQRETVRALRRGSLVALPAMIGSIAAIEWLVASVVDLRWWGAVVPAQILILGTIPLAIQHARGVALLTAGEAALEARSLLLQTLSALLAVAIAAPYGLVALASALLMQGIAAAAISLLPLRRVLGVGFGEAMAAAAKPFGAALAAATVLLVLKGVPYASFPPFKALLLLLLGGGAACGAVLLLPATRRPA